MNERKWTDIEPGESSFSAYEISKKVINLLRHSQTVQREDDGAVQFWRIKNFLQEQHPPDEHREIASCNTNNEFNRAINEEHIDFNVPAVPHSSVKQLHGASVRDLIQKIENHPNRHALQRDLLQSQSFNPFSQESKEMIHDVGKVDLCELLDMEPKAQCKVCLSYWDVGIVYCTCGHFLRNGTGGEQKICPAHHGSPLDSELLYKERATPRAPLWEEARGSRVLHREFAQEEMQDEILLKYSRLVHPRREIPQEYD